MTGIVKTACGISTCEIVNLAWLLESVEAKKPLPAKSYLFKNDSSSPVPQGNGDATAVKKEKEVNKEKGGAKKRAHDDLVGANGAANGEGEDGSKKMKDSQKASSKKLVVPLDEGCTLGGELTDTCWLDDADCDRLLCSYR